MSQEKEKELQQLRNRFRDLADKSFNQNVFTFSGFLGLSEQDTFWKMEQELRYAGFLLFGGIENTDRKMLRFGNAEELGYEVPFPIVCVHIKPLLAKFADKLSQLNDPPKMVHRSTKNGFRYCAWGNYGSFF